MKFKILATALLVAAAPLSAQIMGDFHGDVNDVQKKMIGLAKAIPESAYGWRPGKGVRSVGEVLMHIASENYYIPASFGMPIPESTGMKNGDFKSIDAYTEKTRTKDQIVAELEASFKHLHQGMARTTDQNLAEKISMFGQDFTRGRAMVLTVTHIHEHLGQLIAYARSNNITPPWSN